MVLANLWHFVAYMGFARKSWDEVPKFELIPWKADGRIKKFNLNLMMMHSVDLDEIHEEQKRKHSEAHEEHLKKPWSDPRRWIAIVCDCYEGIKNMLFSSSNDNTKSIPSNIPLSQIGKEKQEQRKKDEEIKKETSSTTVETTRKRSSSNNNENQSREKNAPLKLFSFDSTKAEYEFA